LVGEAGKRSPVPVAETVAETVTFCTLSTSRANAAVLVGDIAIATDNPNFLGYAYRS
jgi:hypothetical protein